MKVKLLRYLLLFISISQVVAIMLHAFFVGYEWNELLFDLFDRATTFIISFALWYVLKRIDN